MPFWISSASSSARPQRASARTSPKSSTLPSACVSRRGSATTTPVGGLRPRWERESEHMAVCRQVTACARMQREDVLMVVAQWLPLTADTYRTAMTLNALNRRFRQHTWMPRRTLIAPCVNRILDEQFEGGDDTAILMSTTGPFRLDVPFMLFICKHCPHIGYMMCRIGDRIFTQNLHGIRRTINAGSINRALVDIQKCIDSETEITGSEPFDPTLIWPETISLMP